MSDLATKADFEAMTRRLTRRFAIMMTIFTISLVCIVGAMWLAHR